MERFFKDRRRAQSGTTLVELLVSVAIIGTALVLLIGAFSSGLLDATLTKRNTVVEAVTQYEVDKIHSSPFSASPQPYSECFASENPKAPATLASFRDPCPNASFTMRADVTVSPGPAGMQVWTVTVVAWPNAGQVGSPISLYKVNR